MFHSIRRLAVPAAATVAVASAVAVTAGYTYEKIPQGCRTCHEMQASYDSWRSSGAARGHKDCIQCHKSPGLAGVLGAQRRGARDIVSHVRGGYASPIVATVPNEFCTSCHRPKDLRGRHDEVSQYAERPCAKCHNHASGSRFGESEAGEHEGRGEGREGGGD